MKRLIILILVVAAVAAVVIYSTTWREKAIVLTGIVTTDDVIVSARVMGRLDQLRVKQGDSVKRGQLLAVIEPDQWQADVAFYEDAEHQAAHGVSQMEADLRFQESQSQNGILQAQATLESAQAQVKEAEADVENAKLTFDREDQLFKNHAETQQAYDLARTAYASQQARLDSLRKQVTAAQAALGLAKGTAEQVAARRAALAAGKSQLAAAGAQKDKAKDLLGYTQVRAPIDGTVDARTALQGEVVNAAQAIVTLINPDDLWVRADVEETYIDRIRLGDRLTVRLPSGAEREGVVFYRAIDADYATQRDVSRTKRDIKTFEVRLRCDNKDRALAVGMTAYVTLPLDQPATSPSSAPTANPPANPPVGTPVPSPTTAPESANRAP